MRKYRNVPEKRAVKGNEIRFDSKKEAARYDELLLFLRAGAIKKLKLQPEFTLQEAFTTPEGERVGAIKYRADFSYWENRNGEWVQVIEDVKGVRTQVYELKKKMMADHGYLIQEV